MNDLPAFSRVHLIGIGGINVSAVAKLLRHAGKAVSGSDLVRSSLTDELEALGIEVHIGHAAENVPPGTELVIYSSAAPATNPERVAAQERRIPELNNFEFLGRWTEKKNTLLITGTHGKSTTTSLVGLMLVEGEKDPTVVVGSRVPAFPEGNLRLGNSETWIIEGDEYARHFLEFRPKAVILNNIELDHTDVFADLADMTETFRALLDRVRDGGLVVANADDPRVGTLIGSERRKLEARNIRIKTFGFGAHADTQIVEYAVRNGEQRFGLKDEHEYVSRFSLKVPGRMNVLNAAGAATLAANVFVPPEAIRNTLANFTGIWRRFERIADQGGVLVYSDYGHHPTAVRETLEAAKGFYPGRRIVLCFQPHHRNRTKHLFLDFVPSFDVADALILVEIYDVKGRDEASDADISSRDLEEAILHHDADRAAKRTVAYAANPADALVLLKRWKKPGDVIIVMGAGDVYTIAPRVMEE
jgi:UDP-N-acetylmuramate--alanine ligase